MAEVALIRPYGPNDKKLTHFMVGKSNMQALAVANTKVYTNPITIAIWIALSSVFIHYMNWWPGDKLGFAEYLRPLPAFASMLLPIIFLVDWINRPYFEEQTHEVFREGDLQNIEKYYSSSSKPGSGFWLLENGDTFVGLLAMDTTQASAKPDKMPKTLPAEGSSNTAIIRHFYVEEIFRSSNIQDDLLEYAVKYVFKNNPKVERIEATDSPLVPYLRHCFRRHGFELDHHTKKVGFLRWKMGTRYLEKERWSSKE